MPELQGERTWGDILTLFAVEVPQAECQPCQGYWPDTLPALVCLGHRLRLIHALDDEGLNPIIGLVN